MSLVSDGIVYFTALQQLVFNASRSFLERMVRDPGRSTQSLRWSSHSPSKGTKGRVFGRADEPLVDDFLSSIWTCPDFPDCAGVPPHKNPS